MLLVFTKNREGPYPSKNSTRCHQALKVLVFRRLWRTNGAGA
jgi:hypothetical protein